MAMSDNRRRGSEDSQVSPRRGNSQPVASPSQGPFPHKRMVMDSYTSLHVHFLTNRFVASTKFLVDHDTVVVAAEDDATSAWRSKWKDLSP